MSLQRHHSGDAAVPGVLLFEGRSARFIFWGVQLVPPALPRLDIVSEDECKELASRKSFLFRSLPILDHGWDFSDQSDL